MDTNRPVNPVAYQKHQDVKFNVEGQTHDLFEEAVLAAFNASLTSGDSVNLDVLVQSRAGARHWDGEDGAKAYKEAPDASVFQRFAVTIADLGRVS